MPIESELVAHLTEGGYHPRTSKHSDFQSLIIIRDLVAQCPLLGRHATSGEIVAKLRHHQQVGHADWVIDIAIGTCAGAPKPPLEVDLSESPIKMAPPVIIRIAVELKSIFTEHGKARLNRLRDFNSFHGYAHQYDQKTVAAAFLVVNASERFYSPLREENDITVHRTSKKTARQVADSAVKIFRSIHLRSSPSDAPGMEAVGVVVVEHDNLAFHPDRATYGGLHRSTRIAPTPPNLPLGDPLHYESMIQRICNAYTQRFG
ncbi:MAG TPA: hypothetical protein VGR03_06665 [Candidatus Acidoferrum sp.]|nr:hypothetical protein [Candidatus Acidoferrum sp.]